ncbi:chemotaxis protein CheC [Priestia flexa]|uniref:Chemotaxis protein CheC n=1 Tax=Priestia flexa TaxID=86664 RepID=A0ABU4J0Q7_9BACI|nr:chemotaxis protein CheC [Priestia flexa]AQX54069.1 hypothetical protein BC359_06910 [Priestia flexa]MBY6084771.1 chemotaxis protein CheC [Priestia flexa]MCA1200300.1 chemotaxis protein CheC [Priestia flexa]MCG7312220.1 chemotaxis protein CheC [Priestia flexa]MCM3065597.1 chemotaxis protein CheC [Priestia flexa]
MTKNKTNLDNLKFDAIHLDVLREIGNIGAANSATALSHLVKKRIEMQLPSVKVTDINEAVEEIGGPERVVVQLLLQIKGDIQGSLFFLLSVDDTKTLLGYLLDEPSIEIESLNFLESELMRSTLCEIGNILCGSYLTALADLTNLHIYPSLPAVCVDMLGATMTSGLLEEGYQMESVLIIETMLQEQAHSSVMKGNFLLVPDNDSIQPLFQALGVPLHG